ncbi:MAG: GntR family transcriptional regulator [Lachnospiraceae bacterium]|nr:GntR family transcriptional regulator [Lachnospiraceae bacterium]MCD7834851.1 GntR family transcriptional regulator [Lachnospiraceae bacterium]
MYIEERQAGENGRDYALRVLKENIIDLELKPGTMVSEKDLAEELGLSRTPVREALQDLAKAQMVDVYPQRGSQISRINYELAKEMQFTRNILEGMAVQLACRKATDDDIRILQENIILQEFNVENARKMMQLDDAFHRELFRIAGRLYTWNMLSSYTLHFDRIREMALHSVKDLKIINDHKQICAAVNRRDEVLAKELMEEHLARYIVDEKEIREKYPAEYFV